MYLSLSVCCRRRWLVAETRLNISQFYNGNMHCFAIFYVVWIRFSVDLEPLKIRKVWSGKREGGKTTTNGNGVIKAPTDSELINSLQSLHFPGLPDWIFRIAMYIKCNKIASKLGTPKRKVRVSSKI